jgi:hypothetical protein
MDDEEIIVGWGRLCQILGGFRFDFPAESRKLMYNLRIGKYLLTLALNYESLATFSPLIPSSSLSNI